MRFKDRKDAARRLSTLLQDRKLENPVVLAIPRGGVVIGDIIAQTIHAPLDVVVSRKIGSPFNPELAIGAISPDGKFYPNSVFESNFIPKEYLDDKISEQLEEIKKRQEKFRGDIPYDISDKTVIIVDDGIATGSTVIVALEWIKKQHPKRIIIATPVGPKDTIERLGKMAEVIVLDTPAVFGAVGEFYDDFDQVDDSKVIEIMKRYNH